MVLHKANAVSLLSDVLPTRVRLLTVSTAVSVFQLIRSITDISFPSHATHLYNMQFVSILLYVAGQIPLDPLDSLICTLDVSG